MQLRETLRNVSRTFAISIEQLPSALREAVTIAYLLFRVSDCLEDHAELEAGRKAELLEMWAQVLQGNLPIASLTGAIAHLDESDPEVYVAQHAGQLLAALHQLPEPLQETIIDHVHQTSLGMARWQEHGPFVDTEEEMDDYMHEVAGRVGYMLTDLFGWYSPLIRERKAQLRPLARQFGLALQTVNIIRGMRKDYERGWVFVPRTFFEPLGLTRDSLFAQENNGVALQVIARLADKAESHLLHGLQYITNIPPVHYRIRLACTWPLFFAIKTLALSRDNIQVILNEAKITRAEVASIIRNTTLMGWSDHWLRSYYSRLLVV
ncbi:MAG: squalene/phytoene synthase family protein [Anaerolineales bacterium]|nr:squalene/phytoene synthase family protein [Anaerolineales bacterium]